MDGDNDRGMADHWYTISSPCELKSKITESFMLFEELQRFLGEIKTDNFTVSNNENTSFGFSLFGITFSPLFYEFSAKSLD